MQLSNLQSLSPVDGRYASKVNELRPLLSEFGLHHQRLHVEIKWLQALAAEESLTDIPALSSHACDTLTSWVNNFSEQDAQRIGKIEQETQHDVKAVEYFIKEKMKEDKELSVYIEYIHFACTSEDINNLAYSLMLKNAHQHVLAPLYSNLHGVIVKLSHTHAETAMLSRTHGQAASPTTLGKEFAVFAHRLQRQMNQLNSLDMLGKFNGAVGNFNAHCAAYPSADWLSISRQFVTSLGLDYNPLTTQIESHDGLAEYLHAFMRFNTILIDLCRDMWTYISMHYFVQHAEKGQVGSSTMPHKINPIDFENAEGNLGIANALAQHLASKLSISRMQRDLTDSTVLRNQGMIFAHGLIAYKAIFKGLSKLSVNTEALTRDLDAHWEVLAEPLQTVMRRHGIDQPYEKLKSLTQGKTVTQESVHVFVDALDLAEDVKAALRKLTPSNYIGLASTLAKLQ